MTSSVGEHRNREELEDSLKHLLDCEEAGGTASADSLAGALRIRRERAMRLLDALSTGGLAKLKGDVWKLTPGGMVEAVEMVRRHRLYETWLARESGLPPTDWHREAHLKEHRLDADATDELADRLGNPRFDPHGDPIPTREGELPSGPRVSLAEWEQGRDAIIEHIEDEPEALFREMVRGGLHAGMVLSGIARRDDGGMRVVAEGRELMVDSAWLGMLHVAEVPAGASDPPGMRHLSALEIGESAKVHGLSPSCYGPERRRLLDLGLVPGTVIRCEFRSPFGSPRSYLVRGALLALRDEQADKILIMPDGNDVEKEGAA